ncbi:MAG TPA: TlpA disulfide reductase family protein [Candidatus Cybelea sp.]|jgi:thiol-disulfide isomerase/thioredoxin
MTRQSILIATGVIILAIIVAAVLVYNAGPSHGAVQNASHSPIVGKAALNKTAPQFEVATTAGLFDLSKTHKPVFLEVFATWCPHCQRMTSVVDRLYGRYESRVDFIGVSGSNTGMDGTSASSELDVLDWVRRFNVRYPVAYDPILNVANLYLQGGFPTFVIIDTNKKVRYLNTGELSFNELDNAIRKVL